MGKHMGRLLDGLFILSGVLAIAGLVYLIATWNMSFMLGSATVIIAYLFGLGLEAMGDVNYGNDD